AMIDVHIHVDATNLTGHFGNPWLVGAAEVIFKNDNVWADLSGLLVGTEETLGPLIGAAEMPEAIPGLVVPTSFAPWPMPTATTASSTAPTGRWPRCGPIVA